MSGRSGGGHAAAIMGPLSERSPSRANPRPEYPRPNFQRSAWLSLNGEWDFGAGNDPPSFDRRILVPFSPQSELSGIGELPGDVVWYRRRFVAPEAECLVLHFGAVDYAATVWVNDVEVARHEGGHTPFTADISAVVRHGDNELVVRADDPATDRSLPRGKQTWQAEPEGIFYTATTGIWQTVWLEPLPHRHVTSLRLWPRLDDGVLEFDVGTSDPEGDVALNVTLRGRSIGVFSGRCGRGRLSLAQVEPWSPEKPTLY